MIFLHDIFLGMDISTLTERGRLSLPASIRKAMKLTTGQALRWEQVSDRELRVYVVPPEAPGPMAALGYGRRLRPKARTTADWMRDLRAGER
jgi:bifunctional DNA-binding transcriptional regulator/antitoxin component of YhaV-PrlF toxin-antitoxin module